MTKTKQTEHDPGCDGKHRFIGTCPVTTKTNEPKTADDMAKLIANGKPQLDDDGNVLVQTATCGTCGRSWNDAMITGWTPAPSARCPFEYWHLTEQQESVLAKLRAAHCPVLAHVTEDHWKRGEAYYMDDRVNVSKRLRAEFNKANPQAK